MMTGGSEYNHFRIPLLSLIDIASNNIDIIRITRAALPFFYWQTLMSERTALSFSQHQQNEKFLIVTPQPPQLAIQHLFSNDGYNEDEGHKVNYNLCNTV